MLHRQTDRQTDRQIDRQTHTNTHRQKNTNLYAPRYEEEFSPYRRTTASVLPI